MANEPNPEWPGLNAATPSIRRKALDALRETSPVAYGQLPGLNPSVHGPWYRALARFFDQDHMTRLEPQVRQIARQLLEPQHPGGDAEIVTALVTPFVFQSLCAAIGWPVQQWRMLADWVQDVQELASKADADSARILADSFAAVVQANLDVHRTTAGAGTSATAELLQITVNCQRLTDATITAILRNWVAVHGTNADALSIVLKHVSEDSRLQTHLRRSPARLPAAIEDILRMDGPVVVNRDPLAFSNTSAFALNRESLASLVWGHDSHLCMGASLARMEIRIALEELLARTTQIELVDEKPARKSYPGNGYAALNLRLAVVSV